MVARVEIGSENILNARLGRYVTRTARPMVACYLAHLACFVFLPGSDLQDNELVRGAPPGCRGLKQPGDTQIVLALGFQGLVVFMAAHRTNYAIWRMTLRSFDNLLIALSRTRIALALEYNLLACATFHARGLLAVSLGLNWLLGLLLASVLDGLRVPRRYKIAGYSAALFYSALRATVSRSFFPDATWAEGLHFDFWYMSASPREQFAAGWALYAVVFAKLLFDLVLRPPGTFSFISSPMGLVYCDRDSGEELDDEAMQRVLEETHCATAEEAALADVRPREENHTCSAAVVPV